jgi:ABC-2 type transport system ATP-binding protein
MIETACISRHYAESSAVNEISFKIEQAQILEFLGPIGAEKSTAM